MHHRHALLRHVALAAVLLTGCAAPSHVGAVVADPGPEHLASFTLPEVPPAVGGEAWFALPPDSAGAPAGRVPTRVQWLTAAATRDAMVVAWDSGLAQRPGMAVRQAKGWRQLPLPPEGMGWESRGGHLIVAGRTLRFAATNGDAVKVWELDDRGVWQKLYEDPRGEADERVVGVYLDGDTLVRSNGTVITTISLGRGGPIVPDFELPRFSGDGQPVVAAIPGGALVVGLDRGDDRLVATAQLVEGQWVDLPLYPDLKAGRLVRCGADIFLAVLDKDGNAGAARLVDHAWVDLGPAGFTLPRPATSILATCSASGLLLAAFDWPDRDPNARTFVGQLRRLTTSGWSNLDDAGRRLGETELPAPPVFLAEVQGDGIVWGSVDREQRTNRLHYGRWAERWTPASGAAGRRVQLSVAPNGDVAMVVLGGPLRWYRNGQWTELAVAEGATARSVALAWSDGRPVLYTVLVSPKLEVSIARIGWEGETWGSAHTIATLVPHHASEHIAIAEADRQVSAIAWIDDDTDRREDRAVHVATSGAHGWTELPDPGMTANRIALASTSDGRLALAAKRVGSLQGILSPIVVRIWDGQAWATAPEMNDGCPVAVEWDVLSVTLATEAGRPLVVFSTGSGIQGCTLAEGGWHPTFLAPGVVPFSDSNDGPPPAVVGGARPLIVTPVAEGDALDVQQWDGETWEPRPSPVTEGILVHAPVVASNGQRTCVAYTHDDPPRVELRCNDTLRAETTP